MKARRSEAIEAERSILGALLIQPDLFPSCSLAAEDFGQDRERTVFAAMAKLDNEDSPIDLVTVKTELSQTGRLVVAGGAAHLASLVDAVPRVSAQTMAGWEKKVHDAAKVRKVGTALAQGLETLKESGDPSSAIEDARRLLDQVSSSCGTTVDLATAPRVEIAARALTASVQAENGVSCGIPSLDRLLGPLKPGQLVIVAARPGVGKSVLLANIGETSARGGRGVLLISAEMTAEEIDKRRLCAESGLSEFRLGVGLDGRERRAWDEAIERTKVRPFYVEENAALTLPEVRAKAKFLQSQREGLALVAVDYLQLFAQSSQYQTRENAVADFSRGLKRLAMDLGLPVVCAAQLNRDSTREEREPRLSDLRESGSIEQDADLVLMLHHAAGMPTRAILAKARNRALGRAELRLNGPLFRFEDPSEDAE